MIDVTRADVDAFWVALLGGGATREEVHAWAAPWVERMLSEIEDPMTTNGLQHLHGFSLRYNPERPSLLGYESDWPYLHSRQEIADGLDQWRQNCVRFDANPAEYIRAAREQAMAALGAEKKAARESGK
jgi:hypothetical protein